MSLEGLIQRIIAFEHESNMLPDTKWWPRQWQNTQLHCTGSHSTYHIFECSYPIVLILTRACWTCRWVFL